MLVRRITRSASLMALALGCVIQVGAAASPANAAELEFKSQTCRKSNSKGCTASALSCTRAPAGKYIDLTSFGQTGRVMHFWNKNPNCGPSRPGQSVVLSHPAVGTYTQPIELCAPTHVESGSGGGDIGKVAYVNCAYAVTLRDLP